MTIYKGFRKISELTMHQYKEKERLMKNQHFLRIAWIRNRYFKAKDLVVYHLKLHVYSIQFLAIDYLSIIQCIKYQTKHT